VCGSKSVVQLQSNFMIEIVSSSGGYEKPQKLLVCFVCMLESPFLVGNDPTYNCDRLRARPHDPDHKLNREDHRPSITTPRTVRLGLGCLLCVLGLAMRFVEKSTEPRA
jgi:hypothetical protein